MGVQQVRAAFADNFNKYYDEVAMRADKVSNKDYLKVIAVRTDGSSRVDTSELSGIGYLDDVSEGSAMEQGELIPGYQTAFVHEEKGKTLVLSHQAVEDDEHNVVTNLTTAGKMIQAGYNTLNKDVATYLYNMFSVAGSDGQYNISASHPINSVETGTTYSNLFSGALTYANLEAAEQQISQNFKAEDGSYIAEVGGRQLIIPSTLRQQAFKIMNSVQIPGAPDWDKNRYATNEGKGVLIPYEVVDFRELTGQSTTAWFIRMVGQDMFRLYMREALHHNAWKENNPVTYNYSVAGRWSINATNAREIWGSTGA